MVGNIHHISPLFPPIIPGSVLTVSGRLTFASNRSMEIEVFVDVSSLVEPEIGQYRAVSAFFVFISLDKYNRVMSVPPLKVSKASVFKTPLRKSLKLQIQKLYSDLSCSCV